MRHRLEAEDTDGVVISVATLIDLWYVTQTAVGIAHVDLAELRERLAIPSARRPIQSTGSR